MYTHDHNYFNELTHPLSFFTALLVTTHSLKYLSTESGDLSLREPFWFTLKVLLIFLRQDTILLKESRWGVFLFKRVPSFTTPSISAANATKVLEMSSLLGPFLALN